MDLKPSVAVRLWYSKIGRLGGRASTQNMTTEQVRDRSRKAAKARWARYREAKKREP